MMTSFLNLDNDDEDPSDAIPIGAGLKLKKKRPKPKPDRAAIAKAGADNGFSRTTGEADVAVAVAPRRGRPPLGQNMTYWRIYIDEKLRDDLNKLRDQEGRRLNDVLQDMFAVYQDSKS